MRFVSHEKRSLWLGLLISGIPEPLIAAGFAYFAYEPILTFFIIWLGLYAVYLVVAIRTAIWNWVVFYVFNKRRMVAHVTDILHERKFPEPEEREYSAESYFQRVADDEENSMALRCNAIGQIVSIAQQARGSFGDGLRMAIVLEESLTRYKRNLRQSATASNAAGR